jgi:hypothetical protein
MADKLTGRTRHRTRNRLLRRPLLVLQVEYEYLPYRAEGQGYSPGRGRDWRDARVEDLVELRAIGPRI